MEVENERGSKDYLVEIVSGGVQCLEQTETAKPNQESEGMSRVVSFFHLPSGLTHGGRCDDYLAQDECVRARWENEQDQDKEKPDELYEFWDAHNARHSQFSGNQQCECFVTVQGDEPNTPFIFCLS